MAKRDHGIVLDEKAQEQPRDKKRAQDPSSRNLEGPQPGEDSVRDSNENEDVIKDVDEDDDRDRYLVHGEGGTMGLDPKPGDLS